MKNAYRHCSETTLECPQCGAKLDICRSCQKVNMHCPECDKKYELNEFINRADSAMEKFLENIYFDRI